MDSASPPRGAARTVPVDPVATASSGAGAASPGPGESASSVLGWVLDRAAPDRWSPLRPAQELVAQVHPDDPVLCSRVLKGARGRLISRADQPLGSRERLAFATLTVAINLSRQESTGTARARRDDSGPEARHH